MRTCFLLLLLVPLQSTAQTSTIVNDFSIRLERVGCLGSCPDYIVTILGDGSVEYDGRAYVRVPGIRKSTISASSVQQLIRILRNEDFFHWEEKEKVCVDFPEVHITVTLKGQRKQVLEGCNSPGEVLRLANEIDRISAAKRWVGSDSTAEHKACPVAAEKRAVTEADTLRTWDALYDWYRMYQDCDDGAIAEGYSESVARILVDHWSTLDQLRGLGKKDPNFFRFVLRHIDATNDGKDLQRVETEAKTQCPTGLRDICDELAEQADSALKEAASFR
jgi:hypothetical protein